MIALNSYQVPDMLECVQRNWLLKGNGCSKCIKTRWFDPWFCSGWCPCLYFVGSKCGYAAASNGKSPSKPIQSGIPNSVNFISIWSPSFQVNLILKVRRSLYWKSPEYFSLIQVWKDHCVLFEIRLLPEIADQVSMWLCRTFSIECFPKSSSRRLCRTFSIECFPKSSSRRLCRTFSIECFPKSTSRRNLTVYLHFITSPSAFSILGGSVGYLIPPPPPPQRKHKTKQKNPKLKANKQAITTTITKQNTHTHIASK